MSAGPVLSFASECWFPNPESSPAPRAAQPGPPGPRAFALRRGACPRTGRARCASAPAASCLQACSPALGPGRASCPAQTGLRSSGHLAQGHAVTARWRPSSSWNRPRLSAGPPGPSAPLLGSRALGVPEGGSGSAWNSHRGYGSSSAWCPCRGQPARCHLSKLRKGQNKEPLSLCGGTDLALCLGVTGTG